MANILQSLSGTVAAGVVLTVIVAFIIYVVN
jgi:hypothetical protein